MPCSMNIDKYFIFFLHNVDIVILVFLEMFLGNEGVDMVSHLTSTECWMIPQIHYKDEGKHNDEAEST
jgi:hypothetical protein